MNNFDRYIKTLKNVKQDLSNYDIISHSPVSQFYLFIF